jgi:two-component system NarL family sensor kinase
VAEEIVGLLALGKRWDETIFDEQDLEVIELMGQQASLFLLTAVQVETLRAVPQAIAEAQERERQRIAQDLHDTVQQFLGRLPLFLQASRDLPQEADAILQRCLVDIEEASRTLRHIRSNLEPVALDQGLWQGVIYLADRFRLDTQIETHLDIPKNLDALLPQHTWQHIYRVIGEALNNIAEHAQATEVQISLHLQKSGINFSIVDNGIGSSLEQRYAARHQGHRGLQFMNNRLQAIGGVLDIESEPGVGTQISGFIPL